MVFRVNCEKNKAKQTIVSVLRAICIIAFDFIQIIKKHVTHVGATCNIQNDAHFLGERIFCSLCILLCLTDFNVSNHFSNLHLLTNVTNTNLEELPL